MPVCLNIHLSGLCWNLFNCTLLGNCTFQRTVTHVSYLKIQFLHLKFKLQSIYLNKSCKMSQSSASFSLLNSKACLCFKYRRPKQNQKKKMTYYLNSKSRETYYFHYLMKNAMNTCSVKVDFITICEYVLCMFYTCYL